MSRLTRREMLRTTAIASLAPALAQLGPVHAQGQAPATEEKKPGPYDDAELVDGPPPAVKDGSFTIAVFPDTQHYHRLAPNKFHEQAQWVADQAEERRIACVLHLGDITNNNRPAQWELAQAAMQRLDGRVPYFMALGNHDLGDNGMAQDRTTLFNKYFPLDSFSKLDTFGGVYDQEPEKLDNSFHLFSAGGQDYLVLALEFGPRKDVVRWANKVVENHADRAAILITHAYMYYDDTRYDFTKYGTRQRWNPHTYGVGTESQGDVNDGQELWDNLVSKHSNFIMTLNGHVLDDGLGRITTPNAAGNNVHQMLVNFQMRPSGGDGWVRLLEVSNKNKTIDVVDYSPVRNQCNVAAENKFQLELS